MCIRDRNKPEADKLIDAAVEVVAQLKGVAVALPSAGGAAGGAVVDSAALDAFAEKVTGSNGVLAATCLLYTSPLRRRCRLLPGPDGPHHHDP